MGQLTMGDTLGYVGRRLVNLVVVIWIAGTLNFVIPRLMPGDPIEQAFQTLASQGAGRQDVAALKASWEKTLGLDAPIYIQYANYWTGIFTLNLGVSVAKFPTPVTTLIFSAVPWTLGLLGSATIVAFAIGTIMGALLAWPRPPRILAIIAPAFMVLSAMPYYLLAILLIATFAITFRIFPPAGGYSPTLILDLNMKSALDVLHHSLLPLLSIVLGAIGGWALGMRALMVNVMGEDYIMFAEAKGLAPRRIFLRYGLRNALLPQVTGLAIALGTVVSGAVLVEAIFAYPGLGGLLVKSITTKDIFVINGIVTILILTLGIAVFTIDLLLPILDPRIRHRR
jgi:peptide/nickel transport system permease protein